MTTKETLAMIEPAFPAPNFAASSTYSGMTLRDYFAAKAMQGLLSYGPRSLVGTGKKLAPFAYEIADELLKERTK
jgi:hypothetical protein